MEQSLWRETEFTLTGTTNSVSLQTLSTLQTLITNPTTSAATISAVLKTLTTLLSLPLHPQTHQHLLSLLSSLSLHRHSLSSAVAPISTSLFTSTSSPRLAAASLSLLLSLPAADTPPLDDGVLISVFFRPCVATRVWMLRNALGFKIRPNLLVTVFLGFTKDPYPVVRRAALEGLARVSEAGVVVEEFDVVDACYFRGVKLLHDDEDSVRRAAVRVVGEWGRMLAALKEESIRKDWFDAVFLQICSVVRDMNVTVKVEALTALGKFKIVSKDILLQSLSKKVLGSIKGKKSLSLCSSRQYEIHAATAAGVFIHGLEDDFSEVQLAACISLRMLPIVSGQFAGEAVNILSYVLNDDSVVVRLEALKTIHHMAISGCLKMQMEYLDMLLGTLVDSCPQIRSGVLDILGSLKLPELKLAKLTIERLLGCLDMYPESEAEIFRTLFSIGQNHGNYAARIIEDLYHKIEPSTDEKFGCNGNRAAGLIVVAVSASFKHETLPHQLPPKLFSYAPTLFGRISRALVDVLDVDFLLQYLAHSGHWCSEAESESAALPSVSSAAKCQHSAPAHVLNAVKLILSTVKSLWSLVKSGCTHEVLQALRYCKGSLRTLRADAAEYAGAIAFAFQYIRLVKLLSKMWEHFADNRKCRLYKLGESEFLLRELDKVLLALRYRFIGLEEEDEMYMLELLLFTHVLTLSSFHVRCKTLHKLSTSIAHVDYFRKIKTFTCSDFVNQLAGMSLKGNLSADKTCSSLLELKKLCDIFMLRDLSLTQRVRQISAELAVTGYDLVTPLRFISGLPAAISLEITLYNVTSEHRLWLKMTLVDELTEFVFLDMEKCADVEEVRKIKYSLPFYRTPRAGSFTLRLSIGMECMLEDVPLARCHGGPKHALSCLSQEKEVYFVNHECGDVDINR